MKQGEKLHYLGKVSRRENNTQDEFEQVADLSGINIYVSLQKSGREIARPTVIYKDGYFATEPIDTTSLYGDYHTEVGFIIDGEAVISCNRVPLSIDRSPLGVEVGSVEVEPTEQVYDQSAIDAGYYEYRVELVQSGNTLAIDKWYSYDKMMLAMGAVFKGDAFTYDDFTDEQKAELKGEQGDAFTYDDFTDEQKA
ncbi:MAG: hypothetical protein R3Y39_09210, partial [Rikenellaceae bacterium]